jgi:hypothetical protein
MTIPILDPHVGRYLVFMRQESRSFASVILAIIGVHSVSGPTTNTKGGRPFVVSPVCVAVC